MTKKDLNTFLTAFEMDLSSIYALDEAKNIISILLEFITGLTRVDLITNTEFAISDYQLNKLEFHKNELVSGKPIQHITGFTHFYGHEFTVNKDVLIPRPETEELVDICIKSISNNPSPKILDLCSGSGCISISLDLAIPSANVDAVELSKSAYQTALNNQKELKSNVNFINQDIFQIQLTDQYDYIISNPPYVMNKEKKLMHKNVLDHEPHQALFVEDENPLIFYQQIAKIAKSNLKPNGSVLLEINEALGQETAEIFQPSFNDVRIIEDLFGKPRFIVATNNCS